MSPDDPRHGSYAGYAVHRRTKTPVCDLCQGARRARRAELEERSDEIALRGGSWVPVGGIVRWVEDAA